jgi:hypothetical protein
MHPIHQDICRHYQQLTQLQAWNHSRIIAHDIGWAEAL